MSTHNSRRRRVAMAVILGLLLVALGAISASAADTTEVVNPADISATPGTTDWFTINQAGAATSSIVTGPATPPLGTGSLQMTTSGAGADKLNVFNLDHAGVKLADITHLGYSTYGNSNLLAITLQMTIDPDGAAGSGVPRFGGGSPVNFATLNFEPYNANTITPNTWQTWNALTDGAAIWASNVEGDPGNGNNGRISNPATWAEFVAFYPNAEIIGSTGLFGVNVGSGWTSAFIGHVDAVKIGYGGNTVTYDFDPAVPCTTVCYADAVNGNDANGGAGPADAKQTIQAAVDAVQAGGQVIAAPGLYVENVIIPKSLTLTGAGQTDDAAGTVVSADPLIGTPLTGIGIVLNNGVEDITIEQLRVESFNNELNSAGIWGLGSNNGLTIQFVTVDDNGQLGAAAGGIRVNGINGIDDVLIDHVTATNNRTRGIVIWDGYKSNITITNNTVTGNNCCGIELQDGTASGVTMTGNTVANNADSGMSAVGLTSGDGPNLIANNTLTNNGRFGIEIKLPNGTGLTSGDGSIVVENNTVTRNVAAADGPQRDYAGIAAFRRGYVAGYNNVDIPTGVVIRNNTVSGYQQPSTSDGFGIVVEGTNMHVTGNTLNNNDVGVQVQAGHTPYTANTNVNGNDANLADTYFGRGNSPVGCAAIDGNTFSGNGVNTRNVNAGGGIVTNVNTSETFCSIQAAVNDSATVNGHTIEVSPGVYAENVIVNKSLTINGANASVSPNDPTTPLTANPARGPETEVTVTGGNQAFRIGAANVTIDGFKFTNTGAASGDASAAIIGAGGNYGGDAPGVKILNNLFDGTSRTVVYFNGPTLMQGGTVEDNRVANPVRPTPCAVNQCGHQLFNLWQTNNLSFQDNVTFAPQAGEDRIRTLNIAYSTNVTIAGNTVRYTCNFTCFTIAANTSGDVTVTDNDLVTDAGNVLQIHSTWTTTGATINVNHNILATGNDFPIVVDDLDADLDNVHINRNDVSGTYHARNGSDNLVNPGTETLDVTCNWWGEAAGPNPANFFGPVDYIPWLFTSDLDGACYEGGTITVVKQTIPDGDTTEFEFDPSWSATNFMLSDGESETSGSLPIGNYAVAEVNRPANWDLQSATCTDGVNNAAPNAIPVAGGDAWTCTFTNNFDEAGDGLLYIAPNKNNGMVGGVPYMDEDIVVNLLGTNSWAMYFDGSDVGITKNLTDFTFTPDNCMLMTFNGNQNVPGVGLVKPQDLVKFCPTQTGTTTAGTFSMYFDGSDVGLAAGGEIIDAVEMLANGDLVISTKGSSNIPQPPAAPVKGKKNDLLIFHGTQYGPTTMGTWDIYFHNQLVPGLKKENIISLYIENGQDKYVSFWDKYTNVGGVSGDANDILIIHPNNTVTKFWEGSDWGYTGRVHGLHIVPEP